jgi:hypothetical protein
MSRLGAWVKPPIPTWGSVPSGLPAAGHGGYAPTRSALRRRQALSHGLPKQAPFLSPSRPWEPHR